MRTTGLCVVLAFLVGGVVGCPQRATNENAGPNGWAELSAEEREQLVLSRVTLSLDDIAPSQSDSKVFVANITAKHKALPVRLQLVTHLYRDGQRISVGRSLGEEFYVPPCLLELGPSNSEGATSESTTVVLGRFPPGEHSIQARVEWCWNMGAGDKDALFRKGASQAEHDRLVAAGEAFQLAVASQAVTVTTPD